MLYAMGEIFLSLLAVFGFFCLLWMIFRRALSSQAAERPAAWAVVAARGSGEGLEQTVKELLWLRLGAGRRYTVLIADAGLDAKGRAVAAALVNSLPQVLVCPIGAVAHYLDPA